MSKSIGYEHTTSSSSSPRSSSSLFHRNDQNMTFSRPSQSSHRDMSSKDAKDLKIDELEREVSYLKSLNASFKVENDILKQVNIELQQELKELRKSDNVLGQITQLVAGRRQNVRHGRMESDSDEKEESVKKKVDYWRHKSDSSPRRKQRLEVMNTNRASDEQEGEEKLFENHKSFNDFVLVEIKTDEEDDEPAPKVASDASHENVATSNSNLLMNYDNTSMMSQIKSSGSNEMPVNRLQLNMNATNSHASTSTSSIDLANSIITDSPQLPLANLSTTRTNSFSNNVFIPIPMSKINYFAPNHKHQEITIDDDEDDNEIEQKVIKNDEDANKMQSKSPMQSQQQSHFFSATKLPSPDHPCPPLVPHELVSHLSENVCHGSLRNPNLLGNHGHMEGESENRNETSTREFHTNFQMIIENNRNVWTNRFMEKRFNAFNVALHGYKCKWLGCGKTFRDANKLKEHKMRMHLKPDEQRHACNWPSCHFRCKYPQRLKRHMSEHTGELPYVCPVDDCDQAFKVHTALARHKWKVHNMFNPRFRCEWQECGKVMMSKFKLDEHMNRHLKVKTQACAFDGCRYQCYTKQELGNHEMTHTDFKRFHCQTNGCDVKYKEGRNIRKHALSSGHSCYFDMVKKAMIDVTDEIIM